jgi:type IV pilus assembly protein PilE
MYLAAFTLLELVIALAIVATLAVFAVPTYRSHIARTHRVDAAAAVYRAAQFIEAAPSDNSAALPTLPPGLDQAPQLGSVIYHLRVLPADDTNGGYSIEATPAESGPAKDDVCGVFTLDATGLRGNKTAGGSAALNYDCWNTS